MSEHKYLEYDEEIILDTLRNLLKIHLEKTPIEYYESLLNRKATEEEKNNILDLTSMRIDSFLDDVARNSMIFEFMSDLEMDIDEMADGFRLEEELDELDGLDVEVEEDKGTNTFGLPKTEESGSNWDEIE